MVLFILSAILIIVSFLAVGMTGGGKKTADFSLGGRQTDTRGVVGILMGSIVGGASTVGTVEMAYRCGAAACWFTMGAGVACLLLGLKLAIPLRKSGCATIAEYMGREYGAATAYATTLVSSVGTFLSMTAQFLASIALLRGIFPISVLHSAALVGGLVLGFIVVGGIQSFSAVGKVKTVLLYAVLILCAFAALLQGHSPAFLFSKLPHTPWFNPFSTGWVASLSSFFSLIVGVFSTQIYIQAIFSAKDAQTARAGAIISGFLIPPLGLLGIWIGLSVRASGVDIPAGGAFSWFILHSFPRVIGGGLWAVLLITAISTIAGLALGIATNITNDLLRARRGALASNALKTTLNRGVLLLLIGLASFLGVRFADGAILSWSYLSMGLRGGGTLLPFLLALKKPGGLPPSVGLTSVLAGLVATLCAPLLRVNSLFFSIAISATVVLMGMCCRFNSGSSR